MEYMRRCLHAHQWPEVDQDAWEAATSPGNILDEHLGRGALWRAPTREKVRKGYGRWLSFLITENRMRNEDLPAERINRDNVAAYVTALEEQVAPWTVWSYTLSLFIVAKAFEPDGDWDWLYKIVAKLKVRRKATRDKISRMRPPHEIANWAYQRLDALNGGEDRDKTAVLQYRDTLFVAILINCPLRLRNLAMIRLGVHLQWTGEAYRLDFDPSEVKTDRYLSLHLPAVLTPYINTWIEEWRPILLNDLNIDALWIGVRGDPMHEAGIYWRVRRATEAAFGVSINPHLFRDIAVTSVVDLTPENIGITAALLGHINPKTTEEHYIQANQAIAGERYRSSVSVLRDRLSAEYGDPFQPKGGV
jgi:integrase